VLEANGSVSRGAFLLNSERPCVQKLVVSVTLRIVLLDSEQSGVRKAWCGVTLRTFLLASERPGGLKVLSLLGGLSAQCKMSTEASRQQRQACTESQVL